MPSASSVHRTLAKKKRSGPTHREVMEKRHAKRRKNEKKNLKTKKMKALEEYQRLSKIEYESKKTTAMNLMELVEDIKVSIPDGTYLKMMDELMALNKERESQQTTRSRIHGEEGFQDDSDEDYIINYFREIYFDRVGNQDNIIRENNRNNNYYRYTDDPNRYLNRVYPDNDNWIRNEDGTWSERNLADRRLQTALDIHSYINR